MRAFSIDKMMKSEQKYEHIVHPWGPLYDKDSRVLILGSLPSPASRQQNFFYGHPRNRFWQVISGLFGEKLPQTTDEKKAMLSRLGIALWDVIAECDIAGASDSSVRGAVPTDLGQVISESRISAVFCNGSKSYELYCKYQLKQTGIDALKLPSTSPANAACSLEKLICGWQVVKEALDASRPAC